MEPSRCDPQSWTHPLGTSSPSPDPASRAPGCPGGLPCPQPRGGSIGVWVGAGLGRGRTGDTGAARLLLQFLSDQLPGTKTPPSPAGPTPALPLLPSQSRAVTCCAVLCHTQTPFHASSSPSPSIPTFPKPRQQAGIQPGINEGLGRGSPWGWDTAGARGTEQHCQELTCRERAKQRGQGRW